MKTENTLFFIIRGDSKLLICPLGSVRPGKVTLQKDKNFQYTDTRIWHFGSSKNENLPITDQRKNYGSGDVTGVAKIRFIFRD